MTNYDDQRRAAFAAALGDIKLKPRLLPHQIAPPGDWYGWLLLGGRGSGKTHACSSYITNHINGPACLSGPTPHWIGIIAPTLGDAVTSCVNGPSGLKLYDPTLKLAQTMGGATVRWSNGSEAKLFGAREPEDIERLRSGGNRCTYWLEELGAWRYLTDVWDQMRFGLRAGPRPHWIASTTPKPKALIKKLDKGEIPNVIVTRATTFDNPHLPKHIRAALEETYGGQQLGAQELYARIIEQDENALFTRANIEQYRVKDIADVPDLKRITVGVDPSGGAGEQGIVVVGLHIQNEMIPQGPGLGAKLKSTKTGYVLDDRTVRLSPAEWGRRVVQAYLDWDADDVVVERNFGGDMAKATIVGAAEAMGVTISVKEVVASRGKRVRAEPVAALASRGQWRFVGTHPELEDQCCVWTPEADYSPDRLDAMVWPAWHMKIATAMQLVGASFPGQQMAQERIAPTQ